MIYLRLYHIGDKGINIKLPHSGLLYCQNYFFISLQMNLSFLQNTLWWLSLSLCLCCICLLIHMYIHPSSPQFLIVMGLKGTTCKHFQDISLLRISGYRRETLFCIDYPHIGLNKPFISHCELMSYTFSGKSYALTSMSKVGWRLMKKSYFLHSVGHS